jgi:hypothetical protein
MKCHGNLNSGKMSHLPGQTRLLEDITVNTFVHSSFGTVVMTLFQGIFTAPFVANVYLPGLWLGLGDRPPRARPVGKAASQPGTGAAGPGHRACCPPSA